MAGRAGSILIDRDRCKGCELCIVVCRPGVIAIDKGTLNAQGYHPAALCDPNGACTGCAACAVVCPDVCISVFKDAVGIHSLE